MDIVLFYIKSFIRGLVFMLILPLSLVVIVAILLIAIFDKKE